MPVTTPSPVKALGVTEYIVQEGDTLTGIALQFDTTVDALMQANDLASADIIYIGQNLKVIQPGLAASVGTPTLATQQKATSIALAPAALPELTQTDKLAGTVVAPPTGAPSTPDAPVTQVVVNGVSYDAYNQAASKQHQWFHYSCEFDAAWVVLKTYGFDVSMDEQLAIVGVDTSVEPHYQETAGGVFIYGGDILDSYSGSFATNFLARTTGNAMRRVFEHYGLGVTPVHSRDTLEAALRRGELV